MANSIEECPCCGKAIDTSYVITDTTSLGDRTFQCPYCSKFFNVFRHVSYESYKVDTLVGKHKNIIKIKK